MAKLLQITKDGPLVDPLAIERIFDKVAQMTDGVRLDDDPLSFGPSYLQKKIALVRNYQSEIHQLHLSISKVDHQINRILHGLHAEIDIRMSDLLSGDPEVTSAPNVKDREALCNIKLRDEIAERVRWESASLETQGALAAIKSQARNLKDLMSRLRDQKKLCEDEIAVGRSWGSKPPPGSSSSPVRVGGGSAVIRDAESFLNDVLDNVEDTTLLQEVEVSEEVTEESPAPEESQDEPSEEKRTVHDVVLETKATTSEEDSVSDALAALDVDAIPEDFTPEVEQQKADTSAIPDGFWDSFT